MNILFIVSEDWYFLSHRLPLALNAIDHGIKVSLLCNCTKKKEIIESYGINVIDWHLNRKSNSLFSSLKSIMEIYATIKKLKPTLVHAVAIKPILFTSIVTKIIGYKNNVYAFGGLGYIFSSKSIYASFVKLIIASLFRIFALKKSTLIFQNKDDKELFRSLGLINDNDTHIIEGSGVNTSSFNYNPINFLEPQKVVLPARMLWDKGIQDFVDCARQIKKKFRARFILVGAPDYHNPEAVPPKIIKKWEKEGIIEWWGHQTDMFDIYKKSTIICLPSYREGLPKVLIEACSVGRPVISYDVPGCREVIKNNVNGFLIPFQNISLFADSICKLLKDEKICVQFGKKGRELVEEKFSEKIVTSKIFSLWQKKMLDK